MVGDVPAKLTAGTRVELESPLLSAIGGGPAGRLLEGGTEALYVISRKNSAFFRCRCPDSKPGLCASPLKLFKARGEGSGILWSASTKTERDRVWVPVTFAGGVMGCGAKATSMGDCCSSSWSSGASLNPAVTSAPTLAPLDPPPLCGLGEDFSLVFSAAEPLFGSPSAIACRLSFIFLR